MLAIAIRSWILFLRTDCYEWIDTPDISREEIHSLCVNALLGALAGLPDYARPTRIDELEAVAGTFERFPELQLIVGHMGENLPFSLARADEKFSPMTGLPRSVA